MLASKVTEKYQATIPTEVRSFLHLEKGDRVKFRIEGKNVIVQKLPYNDYVYLDSLSQTLPEWLSPEDDEAYNDL